MTFWGSTFGFLACSNSSRRPFCASAKWGCPVQPGCSSERVCDCSTDRLHSQYALIKLELCFVKPTGSNSRQDLHFEQLQFCTGGTVRKVQAGLHCIGDSTYVVAQVSFPAALDARAQQPLPRLLGRVLFSGCASSSACLRLLQVRLPLSRRTGGLLARAGRKGHKPFRTGTMHLPVCR